MSADEEGGSGTTKGVSARLQPLVDSAWKAPAELVMPRIAMLNGAPYKFESRRSHALASGLTTVRIEALANSQVEGRVSEIEASVIAYTDAMDRSIHVPDAVYAKARRALNDRAVVELTANLAAYNLVSRFLVVLRVGAPAAPAPA